MRAVANIPLVTSPCISGAAGRVWLALFFWILATPVFASPPAPFAARGLLLDAVLNGHVIMAVGERGAIVRSVDSGETWETIASPTLATLTGISFANPTT